MNRSLSNLIFFVSGIAVGGVSTFLAVKGYFEAKADDEIASVKAAYDKHMEDIEGSKSSMDGEIHGPETIDDAEPGVIKVKSSYVNSSLNNKPPLKDYAKYFKNKDEETVSSGDMQISRDPSEDMIEKELAEAEHPEDDEPYTPEEDEAEQDNYDMYKLNEDHKKAIEENRPPYVIEVSDFELTCAHYPKVTLHYYIQDDIVLTDDDEVVNVHDLLGDCIEESGFDQNEDDLLYVRNDRLGVDYEIEKLFSQFTGE